MRSRLVWIAVLIVAVAVRSLAADRGSAPRKPGAGSLASRSSCPPGSPAHPAARDAPRTRTFGHGAWSWFQDPRAVHVTSPYDMTFTGFIDWRGQITVTAYDPRCGVDRSHVVGRLFHDDHGSPAILVEPNRRLTVFWSGHDGSIMHYRTTLRSEDISAWSPVARVRAQLPGGLGFTYPNPIV